MKRGRKRKNKIKNKYQLKQSDKTYEYINNIKIQ